LLSTSRRGCRVTSGVALGPNWLSLRRASSLVSPLGRFSKVCSATASHPRRSLAVLLAKLCLYRHCDAFASGQCAFSGLRPLWVIRDRAIQRRYRPLSASLIGHSRSSTFRLSTTSVSMSLTGSCFSSESAPRPFHHGIRGRGGTICYAALPSD
jgi:hypothetical protein